MCSQQSGHYENKGLLAFTWETHFIKSTSVEGRSAGPHQFLISRDILQSLFDIGDMVKEISELLSVSDPHPYK